jgi:hypothetical protein
MAAFSSGMLYASSSHRSLKLYLNKLAMFIAGGLLTLPPPGLDLPAAGTKKVISGNLPVSPGGGQNLPADGSCLRGLSADPFFSGFLPVGATSTVKFRNFGVNEVGYFQPNRRDFGRFKGSPGGEVDLRVKSPGFEKFLVATLQFILQL